MKGPSGSVFAFDAIEAMQAFFPHPEFFELRMFLEEVLEFLFLEEVEAGVVSEDEASCFLGFFKSLAVFV